VGSGDDPAMTDDAASTLVSPLTTSMYQTDEPRPRVRHCLRAADNTIEHHRTDVWHSTVAACITASTTSPTVLVTMMMMMMMMMNE